MVQIFNAGSLVGLALAFAGAWASFGIAPALLGLGAAVWLTAHTSMLFALAIRGRG